MRIYDYTPEFIEKKADAENLHFDKERLKKLKPIDVYDYAERILNLGFDWKYITPNCSCDGVTFFTQAKLWVWPRFFNPRNEQLPSQEILLNNYAPVEIDVDANTVVIDQSLIDRGLLAKEKFSVLHECGHFLLHPKGFPRGTMWLSDGYEPYLYGCGKKMTAKQKAEAQANFFAASMLMPRKPISNTFMKMLGITTDAFLPLSYTYKTHQALREMAEMCGASIEAMENRLNSLGLLQKKFDF